jgi:hypothetical protein
MPLLELTGHVDDEEAAEYGDGVLDECGGEIFAEGFGDGGAELCSADGSAYSADGSGDEAEQEWAVREAESSAGECARDDASDELRRDETAGRGGALVVGDLAEGEEGEDPRGEGELEKGERGLTKVDPAETRGPAYDGGGGEGAESSDDSDKEGKDDD